MAYCCAGQHENEPGALWCRECGSLVAGAMIGDYRLLSFVGKGSTSEVYLAEQHSLNRRKVVIKILPQALSNARVESFQREAAVLASLSHPYILPIFSYGLLYHEAAPGEPEQEEQTRCLPYLVLPYAERGSLADIIAREGRRPWPLTRVVTIASEMADALDYAHSQGVLHRDIKPANILFRGTHAMLSDFSVATLIDAGVSHLEAPWAGSPAYMAPEVWQLRPGRYSDQYALAITCFYLLGGDLPLRRKEGPQGRSWAHLHCFVAPRSILELRPDLPIAVDMVLKRALAKNPHERYATVWEFAADLLTASLDNTQDLVALIDTRQIKSSGAPQVKTGDGGKAQGEQVHPPEPALFTAAPAAPVVQQVPRTPLPEPPVIVQRSMASASIDAGRMQQFTTKRAPLAEVSTESLAPAGERDRWILYAFMLNLVISLALAGEFWWQNGNVAAAGTFLLAIWPALLAGPLLARLFRRVRYSSLSWGLFWGTFFGLTNGLLSTLLCLAWVSLVHLSQSFQCPPWCGPGDGLTIAAREIASIAPLIILPVVAGLWMSSIGGGLIGIFNVRYDDAVAA